MTKLIFDVSHALEAIRRTGNNGLDWLYQAYPGPKGQMRKSTTGFLIHEGESYPVKPLGRLANDIAGAPMTSNPTTNVFRSYFESLRFKLIDSPEREAEAAAERQRRLAGVWERRGQAKFRRKVFELFGTRCLITGCETLAAIEAAHVLPVAGEGCDEGWNGIPLRADLHRLFDAGAIALDPVTWKLRFEEPLCAQYAAYEGKFLGAVISSSGAAPQLAEALRKRLALTSSIRAETPCRRVAAGKGKRAPGPGKDPTP